MFEYVIVLYSKGTVTTVIGFADLDGATEAFHKSCSQCSADWAHLFNGQGATLASFGV